MSTSLSLCQNGVCSKEFDITSTSCFPFSQITVTVFAANMFGNGSVSNSITIGQFLYHNNYYNNHAK